MRLSSEDDNPMDMPIHSRDDILRLTELADCAG
jgi:hypothetical protein